MKLRNLKRKKYSEEESDNEEYNLVSKINKSEVGYIYIITDKSWSDITRAKIGKFSDSSYIKSKKKTPFEYLYSRYFTYYGDNTFIYKIYKTDNVGEVEKCIHELLDNIRESTSEIFSGLNLCLYSILAESVINLYSKNDLPYLKKKSPKSKRKMDIDQEFKKEKKISHNIWEILYPIIIKKLNEYFNIKDFTPETYFFKFNNSTENVIKILEYYKNIYCNKNSKILKWKNEINNLTNIQIIEWNKKKYNFNYFWNEYCNDTINDKISFSEDQLLSYLNLKREYIIQLK